MANVIDILRRPSALNDLLNFNPAVRASELQYENLQQVQPLLQQYLQQASQQTPYGGPYQAGFDPTRMAGIESQIAQGQQQGQLAQNLAGTAGGLQGGLGVSQQTLQGLATGGVKQGVSQDVLGTYQNPYLEDVIQTTKQNALRDYRENILPTIQGRYAQSGIPGSSYQAVSEGIAQRGLAQDLATIEAQQRSNAYNAAYQAAVSAGANEFQARQSAANQLGAQAQAGAGLVPTAQKSLLTPGATQEAAGVQFQNQRQAEIDAERQKIQDLRNYGFDVLGQYNKAAGILGPGTTAPNVTQNTNLGEIAQALFGAPGSKQTLQGQALNKILGAVGGGLGKVFENIFGQQSGQVQEIPNTSQPGDESYGWKYYSDGTVIGPDGTYYDSQTGDVIWSPQDSGFANEGYDIGDDYWGDISGGNNTGYDISDDSFDNWEL